MHAAETPGPYNPKLPGPTQNAIIGVSSRSAPVNKEALSFPGPGAYATPSGMGTQVPSHRPTSAMTIFGTTRRTGPKATSYTDSMYNLKSTIGSHGVRMGSSKRRTTTSTIGPGPAGYRLPGGLGKQLMSRQRSQHGRRGLYPAHMHGSKLSERVCSHPPWC